MLAKSVTGKEGWRCSALQCCTRKPSFSLPVRDGEKVLVLTHGTDRVTVVAAALIHATAA